MTDTAAKEFLKAGPFFAGVPDQDIEALLETATLRNYERDEPVFRRGDLASTFYIVMDGKVRIYRDAHAGDQAVMCVFTSTDTFGASVICLRDHPRYPYSATAAEKTRLLTIPATALNEEAEVNSDIILWMEQSLWQHIERRPENELLPFLWASRRVGCLLLQLARGRESRSCAVQVPHSLSLAAVRLGMTWETFYHALSVLKAVGVFVHGEDISISDYDALRKFCCGNCPAVAMDCATGKREVKVVG